MHVARGGKALGESYRSSNRRGSETFLVEGLFILAPIVLVMFSASDLVNFFNARTIRGPHMPGAAAAQVGKPAAVEPMPAPWF